MSETREYNDVVAEKRAAQADYNDCEDRIEDYENILSRLKSLKESIETIKDSFNWDIYRKDNDIYAEQCDWIGSNYTLFTNNMLGVANANYTYYTNSLDYVLDAVNDEITRIENLILKEETILSGLWSLINSLSNELEKLLN